MFLQWAFRCHEDLRSLPNPTFAPFLSRRPWECGQAVISSQSVLSYCIIIASVVLLWYLWGLSGGNHWFACPCDP